MYYACWTAKVVQLLQGPRSFGPFQLPKPDETSPSPSRLRHDAWQQWIFRWFSRWSFQVLLIFTPTFGEIIQFEENIFQRELKPPTSFVSLQGIHQVQKVVQYIDDIPKWQWFIIYGSSHSSWGGSQKDARSTFSETRSVLQRSFLLTSQNISRNTGKSGNDCLSPRRFVAVFCVEIAMLVRQNAAKRLRFRTLFCSPPSWYVLCLESVTSVVNG